MNCPFCGCENIPGSDQCQHCEQPLDFLSARLPQSDVERGLLRDKVQLIATRRPLIVKPDQPVAQVLQQMSEENVGCVVVAVDGAVAGIFTERDALVRLNVEAADLGRLPVKQFLTPSPETIEGDAEIAFALQKMDVGGYRHLPVVDQGRVVAVISIRDILQYISSHLATSI